MKKKFPNEIGNDKVNVNGGEPKYDKNVLKTEQQRG